MQMQVWDTAGQERFRTITQSYYRSAHGAMVAYDITRRTTFESVPHWIREVEQYGAASVVLILIGKQNINKLLLCWSVKPKTYFQRKKQRTQYTSGLPFVSDIPLQYQTQLVMFHTYSAFSLLF